MDGTLVTRRPLAPGGRGGGCLSLILIVGTAFGVAAFLPVVPCRGCRGSIYQERLRITRLPGVTREQADAIIAFAESDECSHCRRGRRPALESLWVLEMVLYRFR